jgi:hypothetical protein
MGLSTPGTIAVGGTALGGGIQALGQFLGGISAKNQAAFQAAVLRNNKLLADQAAEQALDKGRVQAQAKQVETAGVIGAQAATFAGRGIVVNQDSVLEMALDASRIGKLDEIQIINNAKLEAQALKLQGANFAMQAKAAKAAGRDALLAGILGAGGTLIGTAGTVASKWMVFKKQAENEAEPLGE